MMPRFMKEYQGRCVAQGVGRETPEEVTEGAKRNLKAVSNFIGEKHYILGDKPTSVRLFPVFKYLVWDLNFWMRIRNLENLQNMLPNI